MKQRMNQAGIPAKVANWDDMASTAQEPCIDRLSVTHRPD